MPDEDVLRRWFSLEMGRALETFVPTPRPLHDLLRDRQPSATTRSGGVHPFDPAALRAIAEALPALTRAQLRLPLTLHMDHDVPGDVYSADAATHDALRALNLTRSDVRDGRLWISAPLARDLARRFPTLVQFVMH